MKEHLFKERKTGNIKNYIIVGLLLFIICSTGYLLWNANKAEQVQAQQQAQIAKVADDKDQIQKNFGDAELRLDSLRGQNAKLHQQIRGILKKERLTESSHPYLRYNSLVINAPNQDKTEQVTVQNEPAEENSTSSESRQKPNSIKIPVFYGTDRMPTGSNNPYKYYGPSRNSDRPYQVGMVEVSIPLSHSIGDIDLPGWWTFWADKRDTSKYFVIRHLEVLNYATFYGQLKNAIQTSGEKDLFVFIHGFKNSFADAAERTAQLAYDLGFKGAPIMYSWPSAGTVQGYIGDEENIVWTVHNLKSFLTDIVSKTGAKKINLIAHSMGNRALLDALSEITMEEGVIFNQIILAAPDIDADLFKTQIAPKIIAKCKHITLYSSSKDEALIASKNIHLGVVRLGEGPPHIFTLNGIETVDASDLNCSDFFNHSYFLESRIIIDDMVQLFNYNTTPAARNLLQNNAGYWSFKR